MSTRHTCILVRNQRECILTGRIDGIPDKMMIVCLYFLLNATKGDFIFLHFVVDKIDIS